MLVLKSLSCPDSTPLISVLFSFLKLSSFSIQIAFQTAEWGWEEAPWVMAISLLGFQPGAQGGCLGEAADPSSHPSSPTVPHGAIGSALALNWLFLPHTSMVQTHLSSLGKTWCSTFAQSQQNERRRRRSPTPTAFSSFAPYAKPACTVLLSVMPYFHPSHSSTKNTLRFQARSLLWTVWASRRCCSPSPSHACPMPCSQHNSYQPWAPQRRRKNHQSWENQCPSFPSALAKCGVVRAKSKEEMR